jgi:hypothetical protein
MKENATYKVFRERLRRASLRRYASDWEKMNVLLDQHLPDSSAGGGEGSGSGAGTGGPGPFHFSVPIIAGAVIVVVASFIVFSSHNGKTDKVVNGPGMAPDKSGMSSKTRANISNKSSSLSKTGVKMKNAPGYKMNSALNTSASTDNGMKDSITEARNNEKPSESNSANNRNRHIKNINPHHSPILTAHYTGAYLSANANDRSAPHSYPRGAAAGSGQKRANENAHHEMSNDLASFIITRTTTLSLQADWAPRDLNANTNAAIKTSKGSNIQKQKDSLARKTNTDKKNHGSEGGNKSFEYGLTLPLLQVSNANGTQSSRVNYVPGITGRYSFASHFGLGLNILPYQVFNSNSNDSIFGISQTDTANGGDKITTHRYYLSNLNTFNVGLRFIYDVNPRLGFELGFAYQHFYNGSGHVITQVSDTTYLNVISQNEHYSPRDSAPVNIRKSNFNYYLNAVYSLNNWDILLGYNLNSKSWITLPATKSPGWFSLEIRYYFRFRKKS